MLSTWLWKLYIGTIYDGISFRKVFENSAVQNKNSMSDSGKKLKVAKLFMFLTKNIKLLCYYWLKSKEGRFYNMKIIQGHWKYWMLYIVPKSWFVLRLWIWLYVRWNLGSVG